MTEWRTWIISKELYFHARPSSPMGNQLVNGIEGPDTAKVKVIEIAAYDAVVKAHDELVSILKPMQDLCKQIEPEVSRLTAKLDKQENELRTLRDELTWTRAENSNLREECEQLKAIDKKNDGHDD